jgi:hypothetical protein
MEIRIGADPELFVKNSNGELLSGYGMIPGTKKAPHIVEYGAVQVDGMALEFNIDPALDEDEFARNIHYVMKQMKGMIEHELFISPVANFGYEVIKAQPPEAVELGCDPDYNAWIMDVNSPPNVDAPFRTASGHVHIGWEGAHDIRSMQNFHEAGAAARQLDFYLGLPSLFIDKDTTRRELYGKAGAFRNKPYGVEYRVLSNFWLLETSLQTWVFRTAKRAIIDLFENNVSLPDIEGSIEDVINNSDLDSAMALIVKYNLEMPNVR